MSGTWWVDQGELDPDQRRIISLPPDDNVFVCGPPGSGKSNLLLLRANYLYLSGLKNIAIVTFTRSLREFMASGAARYDFPTSKIMTCRQWQSDFLRQYGRQVDFSGDFEEGRRVFLHEMNELVSGLNLSNVFDAILLDEAQDYIPEEIQIFHRLAERLFCVADERQKIYSGAESIDMIKNCIGEPHVLRYHYRNGINICRVADEVAKSWHGYRPLAETSNYDEKANPSTVDSIQLGTVEEQANTIISRIRTQRLAFPGQLIGIICPTRHSMQLIWDIISISEHSDTAFLLHGSVNDSFPPDKKVIVSTFHAAKGLEFRTLHLACCDELKSAFFKNNRRITFTAVTRAKTALSVYHSGDLYGYFDAALQIMRPAPTLPSLDRVFGGRR